MATIYATNKQATSITCEIRNLDTSYSYNDRVVRWYYGGVYKGQSTIPAYVSSGGSYTATGLTAGTTYSIEARIYKVSTLITTLNSTASTLPNKPSLSVTQPTIGTKSIRASWTNTTTGATYEVQASYNGGAYYSKGTTTSSTLTFTVDNFGLYNVRVRATKNTLNSDWDTESIEVLQTAITPLDPPTLISADTEKAGSWIKVHYSTANAARYYIECFDNTTNVSKGTQNNTTGIFTFTSLFPTTTYRFECYAAPASGSIYTNSGETISLATTTPNSPNVLTSSNEDTTSLTLNWSYSGIQSGLISGYYVGINGNTYTITNSQTFNKVITGLTAGTDYIAKVSAFYILNGVYLESAEFEPATSKTVYTKLSIPNLTITNTTINSITINASCSGADEILVSCQQSDPVVNIESTTVTGSIISYTFQNLTGGVTYNIYASGKSNTHTENGTPAYKQTTLPSNSTNAIVTITNIGLNSFNWRATDLVAYGSNNYLQIFIRHPSTETEFTYLDSSGILTGSATYSNTYSATSYSGYTIYPGNDYQISAKRFTEAGIEITSQSISVINDDADSGTQNSTLYMDMALPSPYIIQTAATHNTISFSVGAVTGADYIKATCYDLGGTLKDTVIIQGNQGGTGIFDTGLSAEDHYYIYAQGVTDPLTHKSTSATYIDAYTSGYVIGAEIIVTSDPIYYFNTVRYYLSNLDQAYPYDGRILTWSYYLSTTPNDVIQLGTETIDGYLLRTEERTLNNLTSGATYVMQCTVSNIYNLDPITFTKTFTVQNIINGECIVENVVINESEFSLYNIHFTSSTHSTVTKVVFMSHYYIATADGHITDDYTDDGIVYPIKLGEGHWVIPFWRETSRRTIDQFALDYVRVYYTSTSYYSLYYLKGFIYFAPVPPTLNTPIINNNMITLIWTVPTTWNYLDLPWVNYPWRPNAHYCIYAQKVGESTRTLIHSTTYNNSDLNTYSFNPLDVGLIPGTQYNISVTAKYQNTNSASVHDQNWPESSIKSTNTKLITIPGTLTSLNPPTLTIDGQQYARAILIHISNIDANADYCYISLYDSSNQFITERKAYYPGYYILQHSSLTPSATYHIYANNKSADLTLYNHSSVVSANAYTATFDTSWSWLSNVSTGEDFNITPMEWARFCGKIISARFHPNNLGSNGAYGFMTNEQYIASGKPFGDETFLQAARAINALAPVPAECLDTTKIKTGKPIYARYFTELSTVLNNNLS